MRRRDLLAVLGGAAAAWPCSGWAQQPARVRRIGLLSSAPFDSATFRPLHEGLRQGLREIGYVEGQNLTTEYRSNDGKLERQPELVAELVRLKVDLIIVGNTAGARAARAATTTVPILCFNLGDPVGEGLIASLARPGGNVTGLSIFALELVPKCLSFLKEAVPNASRVAALLQTGAASDKSETETLQQAGDVARTLGAKLHPIRLARLEEIDNAFQQFSKERIEALLVFPSPLSFVVRERIVELVAQHRLPAMFWAREFVELGGLMSYGANFADLWRRGAVYVDKILKGANPAELPVEQPTKFELVVNLRTARALGITIPESILARADEVIE